MTQWTCLVSSRYLYILCASFWAGHQMSSYQISYLAPRLRGIKQKKWFIHLRISMWFFLFNTCTLYLASVLVYFNNLNLAFWIYRKVSHQHFHNDIEIHVCTCYFRKPTFISVCYDIPCFFLFKCCLFSRVQRKSSLQLAIHTKWS